MPSAGGQSPWLLSPAENHHHNHRHTTEKTPLLRMPSAPPPSTTSSAFFSDPLIAQQIRGDPNNNGPLNNNTLGQAQHTQMVELAQQVVLAVKQQQEQEQLMNDETGKQQMRHTASGFSLKTAAAGRRGSAARASLSSQILEKAAALIMTSSNSAAGIGSKSNNNNLSRDPSGNNIFDGAITENLQEEGTEQMDLELVESWSVQEAAANKGVMTIGWQREALDGLSRLRGLGSFLAERLAREAAKQDREWGRARRQRNSLLDALIKALIETENGDGEKGGLGGGGGRGRNGLLCPEDGGEDWQSRKKSRSIDLGRDQQHSSLMMPNGWPGMEGGSSSRASDPAYALSSSSTDLAGRRKYGMVKYQQLRDPSGGESSSEKKVEGEKAMEETEEEEEEEEVIFL